jgi:hypothetical protein
MGAEKLSLDRWRYEVGTFGITFSRGSFRG